MLVNSNIALFLFFYIFLKLKLLGKAKEQGRFSLQKIDQGRHNCSFTTLTRLPYVTKHIRQTFIFYDSLNLHISPASLKCGNWNGLWVSSWDLVKVNYLLHHAHCQPRDGICHFCKDVSQLLTHVVLDTPSEIPSPIGKAALNLALPTFPMSDNWSSDLL